MRKSEGMSHLIAHGIFPQSGYQWFAMEMFGPNLKTMLKMNLKNRFSTKTSV